MTRALSGGLAATCRSARAGDGVTLTLADGTDVHLDGLAVLAIDAAVRTLQRRRFLRRMGDLNEVLVAAACAGGAGDCAWLLSQGANPAYEHANLHPAEWAARGGHLAATRLLSAATSYAFVDFSLRWAAHWGHEHVALDLLPRATSGGVAAALWWSALNGHLECIRLLLTRGVDSASVSLAVRAARSRGHGDAAVLLLSRVN